MQRRDALLFAARRPPYPLNGGAPIRANRLLTGLSRAFDTTLITFEHHPDSPDGHVERAELESHLENIEIITVPGLGPGKRGGQLRTLLSGRSWEIGRYRMPAFGDSLRNAVGHIRPSVTHFDEPAVGQFGTALPGLNVLSSHNVEHRIALDTADAAHGVRRLFGEAEWRRLRREERRLWQGFPLCLAISEHDAQQMRAGGARRVELCPNGTDPVDQLPTPQRGSGELLRILFVGSGAFRPYEMGLSWFVAEVLPRLRQTMQVAFKVVGERPRRPVTAPDVEYVGYVESVTPWYQWAHAVVVPVFQGSGTRLKILEAMAYGRPVVSTRLGAQGLPVQHGEHYLEAEDPDNFARALVQVARWCEDPAGPLPAWLANARSAIEPLFWANIVDRLITLYQVELNRLRAGAAGDALETTRRAT